MKNHQEPEPKQPECEQVEKPAKKAYKKPTVEKHDRIYELGLGSP